MAKVTIKGIENVKERVKRGFDKIKKDESLLVDIGNLCVKDIQGYARSGKNPLDRSNFPSLSDSWIDKRKYLKKFNSPDSKFFLDSRKSNLTFTGKLLESIAFKLIKSSGSVEVLAKGEHPGYKTGPSSNSKKVTNDKLVGYLEEKGFIFLKVSERLRKQINILTKRFIRRLIIKGEI